MVVQLTKAGYCSEAVAEGVSHGAHAQDNVEVAADSLDEVGKHGITNVGDTVPLGIGLQSCFGLHRVHTHTPDPCMCTSRGH